MKKLFKDLTENSKIIYDDDSFAYMKCEDVEAFLLNIDKELGEDAILEKVLQMANESLKPTLSDNFSLIMNRLIENRHLKNDKQEYYDLHKEEVINRFFKEMCCECIDNEITKHGEILTEEVAKNLKQFKDLYISKGSK